MVKGKIANTMSFEEDSFDLATHKKAADAATREKARILRARRQVKFGKIMLAIVTIIIIIALYFVAAELGILTMR